MQKRGVDLLILSAVSVVGVVVLILIAVIADSLESLLLEFGAQQSTAGELGAMVFGILALFVLFMILKFVLISTQ